MNSYQAICGQLSRLHSADPRPCLVGFSGGNRVVRAIRQRVLAPCRRNSEGLLESDDEPTELWISQDPKKLDRGE